MAESRKQQAAGGRQRLMMRRRQSRPATAYCPLPAACSPAAGWTLIELVITMTVLAILTAGVLPMVKTAVRRQREYQLRESLRQMREAIKDFQRDTVGMQCQGAGAVVNAPPAPAPGAPGAPGAVVTIDPRSKVVVADCTVFGVDNILRYPPDLDTLVSGVGVVPRQPQLPGGATGAGPADGESKLPTLGSGGLLANKKKIYLREIPVDPMTGKKDWCLHSPFDEPDTCSDNTDAGLFDVTSKSDGTALDGTKYKDW
jgi:general secretion pathway protein G